MRAVYISPATAPFCVNFARIYKSLPRAGGSSVLRRYEAGRGLSLSQYIFSNIMRRSTVAASFSNNRGDLLPCEVYIFSNIMRRSVYTAAGKRKTGRRFALSVLKFRLCVNRRMTAGARRCPVVGVPPPPCFIIVLRAFALRFACLIAALSFVVRRRQMRARRYPM